MAAEVLLELRLQLLFLQLRKGLRQIIPVLRERPHIRTAEPVDALLRIPHHAHVRQLGLRDQLQYLYLDLVRVLELIHHDEAELRPVALRHLRVLLQRSQRHAQKVIVVHHADCALQLREFRLQSL